MPNDKQAIEKKLLFKNEPFWDKAKKQEIEEAYAFNEKYKAFLDKAKTEVEAVKEGVRILRKNGFISLGELKEKMAKRKVKLEGTKIYIVNKNKNLVAAVLGKDPLSQGVKIIFSHVDSPRMDFKMRPFYEDDGLAFMKTHYYGGIKKYQWLTIPLSLHGIVTNKKGEEVEIIIGEKKDEPVFAITDLLPHLDKERTEKTLDKAFSAEELNILIGSKPVNNKKVKERVKVQVLDYLNKNYGLTEHDFVSAELHAVPAGPARDLGFDKSMILAYGQDDRSCAFTSLESLIHSQPKNQTQICMWMDKEEIGSEGTTGAQSQFLEKFLLELLEVRGDEANIKDLYNLFANSESISADVGAAIDPDYKHAHDLRNDPRLGYGIIVHKYGGGVRGKGLCTEADLHFTQKIIDMLEKNKINWQPGHLGRVDVGGGGTVASYLASRNLEIIDCGPALFNMHAPYEITSKVDIWACYKGYQAFFEG